MHNKKSVLLVKESGRPHKHLERWNLVSGHADDQLEGIFDAAIKEEVFEESGIEIAVDGVVAVYENRGKTKSWLYIVVGSQALTTEVDINDLDVKDAQFFDIDSVYEMSDDELAHPDIKEVLKDYLDGKFIKRAKSVPYFEV